MLVVGFILLLLECFGLCKDDLEIVGKLELHLMYLNKGHYASTGWCDFVAKTCDVYFTVCIWSKENSSSDNCNVARKKTHVIGPHSKIQTSVELPLSSPIPKSILMRIEAWDSDYTSADDLIGTFVSTEIPISSRSDFQSIKLINEDLTVYNSEVRIEALLGLTCSLHYYGPQCETHCKSDFKTFHCGENGELKCLPGWHGEFCNKADACFLKPCAAYARCTNTNTEEGRICYCNGGSGPECYQAQDPCDPSPCHNAGICSKTGPHLDQFVCECWEPWYGPTCNHRYSACALENRNRTDATDSTEEICLNGGICQDDPNEFAYTCVCPSGWKGLRCDEKDYTTAIVVSIVLILIIIVVVLTLIFRKRWRRSKGNRPTIYMHNGEQPLVCCGDPNAPEDIGAISNEIYGEWCPQGHQVQLLSAEAEYAMNNENPPVPLMRRFQEGAIHYATLLWDRKSIPTHSKDKPENGRPKTPLIHSRSQNMRTSPVGSPDEEEERRQSFFDRPSKNLYERSKDDNLEDLRNPLPVKDVSVNVKSKKNTK